MVSKKHAFSMILGLFMFGCGEGKNIRDYREFINLPRGEMEAKFLAMPIDQQIELYVFGASKLRPGDKSTAPLLAAQGKNVIPYLVRELEAEEQRVSPQDIVFIIYLMARDYRVKEALDLSDRVNGWCDRYYTTRTYCHEMGDEIGKLAHRATTPPSTAPAPAWPAAAPANTASTA